MTQLQDTTTDGGASRERGDLGPLDAYDHLLPDGDSNEAMSTPVRGGSLRRTIDAYQELAKPRIALMVVLTAAVGYAFGLPAGAAFGWVTFVITLVGTGLASMGSAVLNQVYEVETDALMKRTAGRPLPSGRLTVGAAALFGGTLIAAGIGLLAVFTNAWAAGACAATAVLYCAVYTPLKRVTWWSMHVGTLPGALPPVIGYAAAANGLGVEAWVLLAVMAVWQLPHFLAIAWLYREDYARAGLPMLPVIDSDDGRRTFRQTLVGCVVLLPLSVTPTLVGMAGWWAFAVGLVLGLGFLWFGVRLVQTGTRVAARKLFFASLVYLPVLLVVLVLDKA